MRSRPESSLSLTISLLGACVLAVLSVPGTTAQEANKRHHFSMSANREPYDREDVLSSVVVSSKQSEGRYTLLDEIWKPVFSVTPHFHATHSETFYVISGQVEWTVDGETRVMTAGDSVYIPPRAVHAVRVIGGKDLHTLMLYQPGGYEEHIEREKSYTDEQLKDPKILDHLRRLNDFNPAPKK